MEAVARMVLAFLLLTVYVVMKHVLALIDKQEDEANSVLDLDERKAVIIYWNWLDVVIVALLVGLVLIVPLTTPVLI